MSYQSDEAKDTLMRRYLRRFTGQRSPYTKATLLRRLMFTWLDPILNIVSRVSFSQDMHYDLSDEDRCLRVADRLEYQWKLISPSSQLDIGSKTPVFGILKTVWLTFKTALIKHTIFQVTLAVLDFMSIYVAYLTIKQVALIDPEADSIFGSEASTKTVMCCLLFIILRTSIAIGNNYSSFKLNLVSMNIRNGLSVLLFKKALRKSLARDTTFDFKEIEQLNSNECQTFANLGEKAGFYLGIPFRIVAGLVGLWIYIGNSALMAFCIFFFMYIINTYLSYVYRLIVQREKLTSASRSSLATEIITNIRQIKISGLENYFIEKISLIREDELNAIRHQYMRLNASTMLNLSAISAFIVAVFTFKIYYTGELLLANAFATIMIFSVFHSSFRSLTPAVIGYSDCLNAARKIAFYMLSDEISSTFVEAKKFSKTPLEKLVSIKISNGNFYWVDKIARAAYRQEKERLAGMISLTQPKAIKRQPSIPGSPMTENFKDDSIIMSMMETDDNGVDVLNSMILKDIELEVAAGACVAILGVPGSGKSSLLSAIANEMYHESGSRVVLLGQIAHITQNPWVPSESIKDIIMFGKDYDETRLKKCICNSGLLEDIKRMSEGTSTVIDTNDTTFSPGLRVRLAVARALYSNKDIYLLNDPTAYQNKSIANIIINDAVMAYLKGKTRLVITSDMEYVSKFDYVVIMEDGKIVAKGTYDKVSETEIYRDLVQRIEPASTYVKHAYADENQEALKSPILTNQLTFSHLQTTSDATIDSIVHIEQKKQGRNLISGSISSYIKDIEGIVFFLAILGNRYFISGYCLVQY